MFSFKRSLIALVGLLVIVVSVATLMPLVSRGQGDIKNPLNRDPRKSYYLTRTNHDGSQALSACASGYHMASLWEIFDTSNLTYNTELGLTLDDSGLGPPVLNGGRVRTGATASGINEPGVGNCQAWTSAEHVDWGTQVALPNNWVGNVQQINPWQAGTIECDSLRRVWCKQD